MPIPSFQFLLLVCFSFACTAVRAQTEAVSLVEASERGPAVASILDRPRETPSQQLQAILLLLDLGEEELAATLWQDFSQQELEPDVKGALVNKFGVARFLKLARRIENDRLKGTRAFAESSLQAAAELNLSPERLGKLIGALSSASAEERRAARSDLAVTGESGAAAALEALAEATEPQLRTELLVTLARMRPGVEPMLIAALAGGQGQFRRDVVELVGHMRLQEGVPWLAAIVSGAESDPAIVSAAFAALSKMGLSTPSSDAAREVVLGEIRRLESHLPAADNPWWIYDAKRKKLTARETSPAEQQLLSIARMAHTLSVMPSATAADRRLALVYAYQVSEVLAQPLSSEHQQWVAALDTPQLVEVLREALRTNQISAAKASAKLLGERKDPSALRAGGAQPSALASAIVHPNRELRYIALEAVMALAPTQSFAGASGVAKTLWEFATSAGDPQAIVASSMVTRASDWSGQLRALGYDATPVATGREAMIAALNSPRLELILVDSDIGRPLMREVIFQLRSRPQVSQIPIAVLSSLHNLPRAEQIALQDPRLIATPRPHTDGSMQSVLTRLSELGSEKITAQRRNEQAGAALGWLADLLEAEHPYDELLRDANRVNETLYNPELTTASLRLLGVLGTADSQQILLDFISSPTVAIETRRLAAEAFEKSVERVGKLLTSDEILRQYDRYNASESADKETQELLGGVLDLLEK